MMPVFITLFHFFVILCCVHTPVLVPPNVITYSIVITILYSGKSTDAGDVVAWREGVGIALDKTVTAAWRSAGELWKSVSSRVIMVRLKWTRKWWQGSDETL